MIMKFNIFFKSLAFFGCLFLALIFAYYARLIYSAREYTINTILPAEAAAEYPLEVSSLTSRQLETLLKVEDPGFFKHHGVDLLTPGAGTTTITQALTGQLYPASLKSGINKINQILIAHFVLDELMPKNMQLRRFINTIYLGPGVEGFAKAATAYFGKPFDQLTQDQYLCIVAMIIDPCVFNLESYPERNKERANRIKLLSNGKYTPKGLLDIFYGKLDLDAQQRLPAFYYFDFYY
ncbi:MAG: transglycosylase domain-containing protein [Desulfobacteraceae bacterium]|nr:transglycosylase domain-containing protein [Desulfobacteraceae bacterium]